MPAAIPGTPTASGPKTLALSRTEQPYSRELRSRGSPEAGRISYMSSRAAAGAVELASSDQISPVRPSRTTAAIT